MHLTCPRCTKTLEFSGERPSFCAYCGAGLSGLSSDETQPHGVTPVTVAYSGGGWGDDEPDPERVAGYRLIRRLGRGGMGTVYEAEDSHHGRRVALKLIARGYVSSREAVERFRQEGRLAANLAHPRCVFVIAADQEEGRPYIVMELMPGTTMATLVEEKGPLSVRDAVSGILDVLEGLREAHRLGVIHRDVKPSNCFVDGQGRFKIGDFGLSKSLSVNRNLTRTGSFLGTPLYVSPEQIRGETLDPRSDVYSTAATLYYALTGRAPHDHGDAAATMARIVSDPAPSARGLRHEIAAELDAVLLKGLERDRNRRWRDTDEFASALRPFLEREILPSPLGLRVAAYLVDFVILFLLSVTVEALGPAVGLRSTQVVLIWHAIWLSYFTILESRWASAGKLLTRLSVRDVNGRKPAGFVRAAARTAVFYFMISAPLLLGFEDIDEDPARVSLLILAGRLGIRAIGFAALASTMRRSNGYRGLHEFASGTRVVLAPRASRRRAPEERRRMGRELRVGKRPVGVLESIGPYRVRGAIRWETGRKVLSAEDSSLGREAWVVIRPKGSPPPSTERRELGRATRPRWLAGGESPEGRWDAYAAPSGCPLADLAGVHGLPWIDARPILDDLVEELDAACAEGSLPPVLSVDQVWVEPDGRVQLLDCLGSSDASATATDQDDDRALALLRSAAALVLEGGQRRLDDDRTPIRAAVPWHARQILDRLFGRGEPYRHIARVRADLSETREQRAGVDTGLKTARAGVASALLGPPTLIMGFFAAFVLSSDLRQSVRILLGDPDFDATAPKAIPAPVLVTILAFPTMWVVWSCATLGGLGLKLLGLTLVRTDGRWAPRVLCAWRTLAAWTPFVLLLFGACRLRVTNVGHPSFAWVLFGLAYAGLIATIGQSLAPVDKTWVDWVSGTRVVPK